MIKQWLYLVRSRAKYLRENANKSINVRLNTHVVMKSTDKVLAEAISVLFWLSKQISYGGIGKFRHLKYVAFKINQSITTKDASLFLSFPPSLSLSLFLSSFFFSLSLFIYLSIYLLNWYLENLAEKKRSYSYTYKL
jgi:hypothetical protein